jgi:hypothetical protein
MAMRETPKTLRLYFILSGLLGALGSFVVLTQGLVSPLTLVTGIINLGFSVAFLYVGFSLHRLLVETPGKISGVIQAAMGWTVLGFLLGLVGGMQVRAIVIFAFTLLLCWYLLVNVRRLAAEAKSLAGTRGLGDMQGR